jgi:hypothetical protein
LTILIALRGLAVPRNLRWNRTGGLQMDDATPAFASPGAAILPDGTVFRDNAADAPPRAITHARRAG